MIRSNEHPLNFCGFSALSDLGHNDWHGIYARLEQEQTEFLSREDRFRSAEYRWPRDPLHTWSRLWEYPYVLYHLEKIRHERPSTSSLTAADIGSGVTFFPFSAARLGYHITCIDIDPVCERDIPAAARLLDLSPGCVDVALLQEEKIPLSTASQDVVYCISVLEHIPDFGATLLEIARVLKSGGKLILTVDIDLRGDSELSTDGFELLQRYLSERFVLACPQRVIHPSLLLTSDNSHFPYRHQSTSALLKGVIRGLVRHQSIPQKPRVCQYLTVYSCVLTKI
jgi:2-polyprenyl-3-methyl-5-hydroxy-6-metoxy-1,4-benzoquinol methylase